MCRYTYIYAFINMDLKKNNLQFQAPNSETNKS